MKKFTALNRILALLTAVIICFSSLASLCGVSYAQSHPRAVNEGKSAEEIEAEDLAAVLVGLMLAKGGKGVVLM